MKQYKLVNNLVGWLAFVIAAYTYCMTIEPTASFWDCPEFITTGYKLEFTFIIPYFQIDDKVNFFKREADNVKIRQRFFMLTANLFSQFTSDPSQVARMASFAMRKRF